MARRSPYSNLTKSNQIRSEHVKGMGDIVFKGFNCLNPDCKEFIFVRGPSIGFGANIHPALAKSFCDLAEEIDMPFTRDPLPNMSGTDAVAIQNALGGVMTGVISIPLRYMHTPVEVITMKDVRRAGRLIAEYISRLTEESFAELKWEDES